MPRSPRLDYVGARHHVYNRGARRQPIFLDEDHCVLFLNMLSELPARFGVVVHAYVLMSNHYHLMLTSPRGNLSEAMQFFGSQYVQRLNAMCGWDGPVFRGRYRNRVVEEDTYWRHLLAYLHDNPVKAKLVRRAEDWAWSSHLFYEGSLTCPPWMECREVLDLYGTRKAYLDYLDELRVGRAELPECFDEDKLWAPVVSAVADSTELPAELTLDVALDQVCDVTGVEPDTLLEVKKGRGGNRPRRLAAWWLNRATSKSQVSIGKALNMSSSAVGKAVHSVRHRDRDDEEMTAWKTALLERRGEG